MTSILAEHHGRYSGTGSWRDDTGAAHGYQASPTLAGTDDGLRHSFFHVCPEDPGQPDVALDIMLKPWAPSILGFDLDGLAGRGYWDDAMGALAHAFPLPGNLVETSCSFSDDTARVGGSSEKNAAARHIMWTERLTRG